MKNASNVTTLPGVRNAPKPEPRQALAPSSGTEFEVRTQLSPLPKTVQWQYDMIQHYFDLSPAEAVLDVGTDPDPRYVQDNPLLAHHFGPRLACSGAKAPLAGWQERFPYTRFYVFKDGCVPVEDKSFDVVVCRNLLEHMGDKVRQVALIAECVRIARRGVLITTQNRWDAVDDFTSLPLLHWLPRPVYASVLGRLSGYQADGAARFGLRHVGAGELHAMALDAVCSFKKEQAMPFWLETHRVSLRTDIHLVFSKPLKMVYGRPGHGMHVVDTDLAPL